jgi:SAM-dependent methyltransferase
MQLAVPCARSRERREDRVPGDDILQLAFEVRPHATHTRLTVARPRGEGERRRGHGIGLPFVDASFAAVVCRHGLQLLPDRGRALGEMRRVLVRGGEIVVAVPGAIERNPPFAELADSLERHAGARCAAAVRWHFCMPEPDDVRGALAAAGFEEIRVDVVRTTDRPRSIAELLSRSGLDPRIAILRDLESAAGPWVDRSSRLLPSETIMGRARRP